MGFKIIKATPFPPRLSTQKGAQRTCDWLTGVLGDKGGVLPSSALCDKVTHMHFKVVDFMLCELHLD